MPPYNFYHYTDEKGARAIQRSRYIKKTPLQDGQDALLGTGVYLTKIHPGEGREDICMNNYGSFTGKGYSKTEYVIKMVLPERAVIPGYMRAQGRDVWIFKGDLDLNAVEWTIERVYESSGGVAVYQ